MKLLLAIFAVAVGLAVLAAVLILRATSGTPVVSVDYVAQWRALRPNHPALQSSWPTLKPMVEAGGGWRYFPGDHQLIVDAGNMLDGPHDQRDWDAIERGMWEARPRLAFFRNVARYEYLGVPFPNPAPEALYDFYEVDPLYTQVPSIMRMGARLLWRDAELAAHQADWSRFERNVESIFALAGQLRHEKVVLADLSALGIAGEALSVLDETLLVYGDQIPGGTLERLAMTLARTRRISSQPINDTFDELVAMDTVQRIYTDNGRGSGRLSLPAVWASSELLEGYDIDASKPTSPVDRGLAIFRNMRAMSRADAIAEYESFKDKYRRFAAIPNRARDPMLPVTTEVWARRAEASAAQDYGRVVLLMHIGTGDANPFILDNAIMSHTTTELAIAVHRYRRETGWWPRQAKQVVPRYLDELPIDSATGDEVRYRVTDEGPVIYSVGGDRDDDGGRHDDHARFRAVMPQLTNLLPDPGTVDGDVVLYPPEIYDPELDG